MARKNIARRALPPVLGGAACLIAQSASAQESFLGEVAANALYEAEAVVNVFPRNAHQAESKDIEGEAVEVWTHLNMSSDTFIGDYWSFGLGMDAVASSYRGEEAGVFSSPGTRGGQGRFLDVSRLVLSYLGDDVEVHLGKDDIPFGLGEIYSPTDLYAKQNSANPQNAIDYGVWQARADYYIGSDRLSGFILPFEEKEPGPADHSRWVGGNGGSGTSEFSSVEIPGLPAGLSPDIRDDLRGASPSEWGYLVQYKGTATGLDYFVSGFNGPSPFPVLKRPDVIDQLTEYDKVYPRVTIASAGAAMTEGSWKFYAEGIGLWAINDTDEDIARALAGVKYRETTLANRLGFDEITPIVEYAKEWRFDQQSHPQYVVSSANARPNPNNLILSVTVKVDSEWEFGGGYNESLTEHDSLTNAYIKYSPNDNLWMALSGTEYGGDSDTLFGRYNRHDNVSFQVNYSF